MRIRHLSILSFLALFAGGCAQADEATKAPTHTFLDESGAALRSDFNKAKGTVRLLFVVDPICPGCLRGLDDMNRDLLSKARDPRLQTFVVHLPVLSAGAQAKDVAPAAKLLTNPDVRHYWNPSGAFGDMLTTAVALKNEKGPVYAWDVWLIYGPEAEWEGPQPPQPRLLMHQLRALQGSKEFPHLDSEVFARDVQKLLATLPASPPQQ